MERFESLFKKEFKDKYVKYVISIRNNLICAYYDSFFLEALSPYAKRNKQLESFSFKLITQIVRVFWSDLILSITKLLETDTDSLSIKKLNGELRNNKITSKNIRFISIKYDESIFKKIKTFRLENIAHSLDKETDYKLDIIEIRKSLNELLIIYNDRQFIIDGTNYLLSNDNIKVIENNAQIGVKELFKKSHFE